MLTANPVPLPMTGAEMNKEALIFDVGKLETGEDRWIPEHHQQPASLPFGDGEGQKAAEAELGRFSFKTQGLLVLEGVDEDVEDADATFRDELIMLARDDPMWREELRRYLQEEEKERELIQKERAARLARWREDMAVQAT